MWKMKYGRQYVGESQENKRFVIFQTNMRFIESHPQTPYTVALNQFGDLTAEEFGSLYRSSLFAGSAQIVNSHEDVTTEEVEATPSSWDWRTKGVIGPVEDQGQMGDVVAIVTADNLNSMVAINNSQPVTTSCSVDNLNDCVSVQTLEAMFNYAVSHGVDTTASYPVKGKCSFNPKTLCVKLAGFQNMSNEVQAKTLLYQTGPMSASFDAGESSFQFYSGGIYNADCTPISLDHAMLLVGYGVQGSTNYWIAQNSWGAEWGIQGYAYIHRGSNTCGIMSNTLLPTMPR